MAKLSLKAGTTSYTQNVFISDSASTTGGGKTGITYNAAGLSAYYVQPRGSATAITLATQTVTGSYSSGGFVEIDATNMPGMYRFDIPNAALTGAVSVAVMLKGASGMAPLTLEIELTATDNQDSVRGGMTALPNAAAAASGGLLVLGTNATAISFTGGMTISSSTGDALAISSSGSNGHGINASGNGTGAGVRAIGGATGAGLRLAGGATSGAALHGTTTSGDGILLAPTAGHGISSSANGTSKHGLYVVGGTGGTSDGLRADAGTGGVPIRGDITGSLSGSVGSVTGAVGSVTGAVASVTGNVGGNVVGSVASVTGAVGSVTGNVGGNVVGSVGSVTGSVGSVAGNVGGNVAGSVGSVASGVTLATGQVVFKKNTSFSNFQFIMTDSSNVELTGLTVIAVRSLDGAAFGSCANSVSEVGSGLYKINLAAGDMNANSITLKFSATGAKTQYFHLVTQA